MFNQLFNADPIMYRKYYHVHILSMKYEKAKQKTLAVGYLSKNAELFSTAMTVQSALQQQ